MHTYFSKPLVLLVGVSALAMGILAIAIYHARSQRTLDRFETVAVIDGAPVAAGELVHYLHATSSEIYTHFKINHGVDDNDTFWTTAYGGETPIAMARERALRRCVRDKVQQVMALKLRLVSRIDYRSMLADMQTLNEKRQRMVALDQVVYGPVTFDEQRYLDQVMIDIRRNLRDKLAAGFVFADQDYADYYAQNKARYSLGKSTRVKAIVVRSSYGDQGSAQPAAATRAKLAAIEKRIASGTTFDANFAQVANANDGDLRSVEQEFSSRMPRTFALSNPALFGEITRMSPGYVTGVIEENGTIGIYKCDSVVDMGYAPLPAVKSGIWLALVERRYEELVDRWASEAQVRVVEQGMNRVRVR